MSCKLVGGTPCGLGVGVGVVGSILVYECCKLVAGTPSGLGGRGSLY